MRRETPFLPIFPSAAEKYVKTAVFLYNFARFN